MKAEELQKKLDNYLQSFDEKVAAIQKWKKRKAEIKRELDELNEVES